MSFDVVDSPQIAREGENEFCVPVNGTAEPEPDDIELTRDNGNVPRDTEVSLEEICFDDPSREDSGNYTLFAENEAGNDSVSFELIVQCK